MTLAHKTSTKFRVTGGCFHPVMGVVGALFATQWREAPAGWSLMITMIMIVILY